MPLTGGPSGSQAGYNPPGYQAGPPPSGAGFGVPYGQGVVQMRRERVRQNLQPMGITWCLWGLYRLLMGAVAGFTMHEMALHHHIWSWDGGGDFVPGFLAAFVPVIAVTTVVMAGLALLTGYGLLTARPWGRTLAIVMAILSLIKIPLGTALGIYTLWVLAPRVSGYEYEALTTGAPRGL